MIGIGGAGDVTLVLGGKKVGTVQSIKMGTEITALPARPRTTMSGTGTMTDAGVAFFAEMLEQLPPFDVVKTEYRVTPPRPIRSKKKRQCRKWQKQYEDSILRKTLYRGCTVESMH